MNKKDIQALKRGFRSFNIFIMQLFYPNKCVMCGKLSEKDICDRCKITHPVIAEPRCMCCGKPVHSDEIEYCNDCMIQVRFYDQGRSLWLHSGNVKKSIYRFKYKNNRINAKVYARLLVEFNQTFLERWKPEGIVPIPIHAKRRRKRGYNQAEVLAREIKEELQKEMYREVPIITDVIYRKKETKYQKKLDNYQRRKNIKGAFGMKKSKKLPASILVVDDIYTTGATIQEVSKLLRDFGVEQVVFLTISIGQGF